MLLSTIWVGRKFQILMLLFKKKCFASFDLKHLPMILKPLLRGAYEIGSYIIIYVNIVKATEQF